MASADFLAELTASDAAAMVKDGDVSAQELVEASLARIRASDGELGAWACVDTERAVAAARLVDEARARGESLGGLAGIPLGVKDVIDVVGLPTKAGFEPFESRIPTRDAAVVAALKREGAIVVGKTVTAQLAFADPPPTVNPWDSSRSPGGSSSGSGVAVATRHVPMALATQTGGSTLRPAAFTGCVGFKPSYGLIPMDGILPLAWSLDHVGVIARTVKDCRLFLCGAGIPPAGTSSAGRHQFRLGVMSAAMSAADDEVRVAAKQALERLREAGAILTEVSVPMSIEVMRAIHLTVMQSEAAAAHLHLFARHAESYEPKMRALVKVGRVIPAALYLHARQLQARARLQLAEVANGVDALVLPTATSLPPPRETTGSSWFQAIFSLSGFPSVSLPFGPTKFGLPNALQLAAATDRDHHLLTVAEWCGQVLGGLPSPVA
jgi:aspartyl-tRNA(Asn)/glutamyl-tRNA(Gln) amidotransferase subunit A